MDADKGQLRYAGALLGLVIAGLILAAHLAYVYLADPERFPVNTIKVAASYQHVSHKELETLLESYANYSFFLLPVTKLCKDLKTLAWVDEAHVERIWPDIVKVSLVEKIPIAIWNNALMSEKGDIFNPGVVARDWSLPELKGAANQMQQVLHVYQKMSKILTAYGLSIAKLTRRKNDAWELTLANGVTLRLGKQDLAHKLERFCKAYPAVFRDKLDTLASVDLRYPRGMAVQWKSNPGGT